MVRPSGLNLSLHAVDTIPAGCNSLRSGSSLPLCLTRGPDMIGPSRLNFSFSCRVELSPAGCTHSRIGLPL